MSCTVSGLVLWEWWRSASQQLVNSPNLTLPVDGSPPVPQDVELKSELDWLMQVVTGLDSLALRLGSFKDKDQVELRLPLADLVQLWQRRISERVPVQYLVGMTPWRHFSLKVSPAVLIPRPETEELVDLAVTAVQGGQQIDLTQGHWGDLGTGSGAIALGLATVFPSASVHAVDCSHAALVVARQNAQSAGLQEHIQFYQGWWLEPLDFLKGRFSGLVANPPYIPTNLVPKLQPEVAWHEPWVALDGGPDGLACIRHLIAVAPAYLQRGGILLFEMMAGQADAVSQLLQHQGSYRQFQIYPDLAGVERFALAYRH